MWLLPDELHDLLAPLIGGGMDMLDEPITVREVLTLCGLVRDTGGRGCAAGSGQ